MMSWFDDPHRGTRDLDLLGFGDPGAEHMLATLREILTQEPVTASSATLMHSASTAFVRSWSMGG